MFLVFVFGFSTVCILGACVYTLYGIPCFCGKQLIFTASEIKDWIFFNLVVWELIGI